MSQETELFGSPTKNGKSDLNLIDLNVKDLKIAIKGGAISRPEARYLVDSYYQIQEYRKASGNQIFSLEKEQSPFFVLQAIYLNLERLETHIRKILDYYSDSTEIGLWAKSIIGIGPVISAGLQAYIDINKAKGAGAVWRIAGLDPSVEWLGRDRAEALVEKYEHLSNWNERIIATFTEANRKPDAYYAALGNDKPTATNLTKYLAKRPWNAGLKVLAWKIGESFVKVSGNPKSLYGRLYVQRKQEEIEKNEGKLFSEQAAAILAKKKIGKSTDAYKAYIQGILPPAHIHARAKRYATKMFLAHYFEALYHMTYQKEPPLPYAIEHLGHVHNITWREAS